MTIRASRITLIGLAAVYSREKFIIKPLTIATMEAA